MKLKRYQAKELFEAIGALNGRQKVVRDSEGKTFVVLEPYEFDGADVRCELALARATLREHVIALEEAIKATYEAAKVREGDPVPGNIQDAINTMLKQDIDIELTKVKQHALKINENKLPVTVIEALLPLIDRG